MDLMGQASKAPQRAKEEPLVTIHDSIAILPNDMDSAQERIRRAMIFVCQGNPLAKLADDLAAKKDHIGRLPHGEEALLQIAKANNMFN